MKANWGVSSFVMILNWLHIIRFINIRKDRSKRGASPLEEPGEEGGRGKGVGWGEVVVDIRLAGVYLMYVHVQYIHTYLNLSYVLYGGGFFYEQNRVR